MDISAGFLSVEPLIGATSVVSAVVLFRSLKSTNSVGVFAKVLVGIVWFLFLCVGMLIVDASEKIVPVLFWVLQLSTVVLLIVISRSRDYFLDDSEQGSASGNRASV